MKILFVVFFSIIYFPSFSQMDTMRCDVYGCSTNFMDWMNTRWYLNDTLQDYNGCGQPSVYPAIHVAVIDTLNCKSWGTYNCEPGTGSCGNCTMVNTEHQFGNLNNDCGSCRNRVEKFFIFRINDPISMAYLDTMLTNPILNGQHLLMYSWNCTDFDYLNTYFPNTISIFQNLGFITAPLIDSTLPFIYYAEVGNPTTAVEVYGQNSTDFITLSVALSNCGSTVGITENAKQNLIYPTVIQNGNFIHVNYDEIEIYDLTGKLQKYHYKKGNSFLIDGFDSGIYFLKIKRENQFVVEKIIVWN